MDIKGQYTLADFNDYAPASDSLGFALISNANFCEFKKKSYFDENGVQKRRKMVRVGPYFLGDGLKEVWALATGLSIGYFYGYENSYLLARVEDRYRQRIYYGGTNFSFIAAHESETKDKIRTHGKVLVETVINYVFLARRELGCVKNERVTDMLANFAQACLNYPDRKRQEEDENFCKREEIEQNDEYQAAFRRANFNGPGKERLFGIKTEPVDESSQLGTILCRPSSTFKDLRNYETNLDVELEREKEAHAKHERMLQNKAAKHKADQLRARHQERTLRKKLARSKKKSMNRSAALLKAKQALQAVLEQERQDESSDEGTIVEVEEDDEDSNGDMGMVQDYSEDEDYDEEEVEMERPRKVSKGSRRHA